MQPNRIVDLTEIVLHLQFVHVKNFLTHNNWHNKLYPIWTITFGNFEAETHEGQCPTCNQKQMWSDDRCTAKANPMATACNSLAILNYTDRRQNPGNKKIDNFAIN